MYTFGQNDALNDNQIKFEQRFKKAKQDFVNNNHEKVIAYYDSILSIQKYTRITTYKMAYNSYQQLILELPEHSDSLKIKANNVYKQAKQWYGEMFLQKKWDSISIDPNTEIDYFDNYDKVPEYPGGISAFYAFLSNNIVYPTETKKKGIEGKVYITFIVNIDGSVDAVNVLKGIDSECDAEAVRVIRMVNKFIPGSKNGEPKFVRMQIPIIFGLISSSEVKNEKKIKKEVN